MNNIYRLSALALEDISLISQVEFTVKTRPDYQHKVQKLIFFSVREGLRQTFQKIRSKKEGEKIAGKQYLTIIKGIYKGEILYNFSIQYDKDPRSFIVQNRFYPVNVQSFETLRAAFDKLPEYYNQFDPWETGFFHIEVLPVIPTINHLTAHHQKGVFIIGLGDYSRTYIAPHLKLFPRNTCVDYNINLARAYKERFKFDHFCLTVADSLPAVVTVKDPLIIIASYHSDHSDIALQYYRQNPASHLFIEKPPCVTLSDLDILRELYNKGARLEIGFNRRYIPFNQQIASLYKKQRKIITLSVKEVNINSSHWYFWNNQGTRITGNLVHWIDLCNYWIEGIPEEITLLSSTNEKDTLAMAISYSDGSLVNISVSDAGNALRGVQEHIEIRMNKETIRIDDYTRIQHIKETGKKMITRNIRRNKGHHAMYKHLSAWYNSNTTAMYPARDLVITSLITIFASQMFVDGVKHKKIGDPIRDYLISLK